jgi:hypothetical protein
MTATDKKKLAVFDRHNARLSKYEKAKNCNEATLVAADRIMWRMAAIRDGASPELRKALRAKGWQ